MTENNNDEIEPNINEIDGESANRGDKRQPEPFRNPIPQNYLGHIVAKGEGLKIGRNESLIYGVIQPDEFDRVEVGDYIRIPFYRPDRDNPDVQRQLLCSVESLTYTAHLEDRQFTSVDSFGAEQYTYIAELDPISEITVNDQSDDEFQAGFVSTPPRPTVKLDIVDNNNFLRCGLDIPKTGIYIGDVSVNGVRVPDVDNPLEYYLFNPNKTDGTQNKGEPSIFRHILVAGSTGTGKTHTSKNILRQLAKCKKYKIDVPADEKKKENTNQRDRSLNITIIDPEDEYTELGRDPENMDEVEKLAENRAGLEYGAIGDETEFEIYAPQTSDSSTKELDTGSNKVTNFGIPFEIVKDHKELMMPSDPPGQTRQLIVNIIDDYFRDTDKPYKYSDFREWLDIKIETYMDNDKYPESIVSAAERRLTGRNEYSAVFDQASNKFTDENMVNNMFSPNKVSVITTGHLRGASQNLVVQAISSYIVESKISSDPESTQIKGTPMILALDEAHEYLQQPETTREHFIVNKFRRAARRGRKDKFGLYFITQNPADIDGEVRNQINTKVYLQLDRKVVDESDVYVPKNYVGSLPEFNTGQMVVDQPDVNPVEVVGLRYCLTKHTK